MTILNAQGSWNVGKVSGACAGCGAELPANAVCWAALCDQPMTAAEQPQDVGGKGAKTGKDQAVIASPFARADFCEKCWGDGRRPEAPLEMFSYWKTTVPVPQQKKKLLVDDSVLLDVFGRMEGRTEPTEVRFRFVLALILMRKRLLKYEGMEEKAESPDPKPEDIKEQAAPEVWRMIPRGGGGGAEQVVHVINPHLTAEQITEVSQQLSAILAEEV